MRKRTQAREFAVQMMYQSEMTGAGPAEVISTFWKSFDQQSEDITVFAESLFAGADAVKGETDGVVRQFLKEDWPFDRLGEMEKCVLRVALNELLNSDTPTYAVLDDYVTLTRRFTDDKTASFVNGLLENVRLRFKPE